MKVLVTGSKGFVGGYVVEKLLENNFEVIGLDNETKYGKLLKSYDNHPNYTYKFGDAKNILILKELLEGCDHFIAGAAMIGGISYFHEWAYDLIAENERITAAAFDAAIWAHKNSKLKKITVLSSSMVYESATIYPTPEGHQLKSPPPLSTYGFQKLATEYFARGAYEQYKLPFTIIRPFNCIGIGEKRSLTDHNIFSGNIKLAMSHVVPDLIQKILKGQYPLKILGNGNQIRHYTYGEDLAEGIYKSLICDQAVNEDFNISTDEEMSVINLAKLIWIKINPEKKFEVEFEKPFEYDVQKRVPDTSKASRLLNFNAKTPVSKSLDIIIPWIKEKISSNEI
jgi:nucleoside-diphosphate-sugar epimerase